MLALMLRQNPEELERLQDQARTVEATAFAILFIQTEYREKGELAYLARDCEERASQIARSFLMAKEERLMQEHKDLLEAMKTLSKE